MKYLRVWWWRFHFGTQDRKKSNLFEFSNPFFLETSTIKQAIIYTRIRDQRHTVWGSNTVAAASLDNVMIKHLVSCFQQSHNNFFSESSETVTYWHSTSGDKKLERCCILFRPHLMKTYSSRYENTFGARLSAMRSNFAIVNSFHRLYSIKSLNYMNQLVCSQRKNCLIL